MPENRWNKEDKGVWDTYTLLCDECTNKLPKPIVCSVYQERKPSDVLKGSTDCPKFTSRLYNKGILG